MALRTNLLLKYEKKVLLELRIHYLQRRRGNHTRIRIQRELSDVRVMGFNFLRVSYSVRTLTARIYSLQKYSENIKICFETKVSTHQEAMGLANDVILQSNCRPMRSTNISVWRL